MIEQCCLQEDLEYLDAGDQTEVGEKGVTLRYVPVLYYQVRLQNGSILMDYSGGQKVLY